MERVITQGNKVREGMKMYVGFCTVATTESLARTDSVE